MYISKIRVKDYKSFRDSGEIEFKPGINLIVGQNNAGKTTLLEALEIKIRDMPHRSLKTSKNKVYANDDSTNSTLYISINLMEDEGPAFHSKGRNLYFRLPFSEILLPETKSKININEGNPKTIVLDYENKLSISNSLNKKRQEVIDDFVDKFTDVLQSNRLTFNFKYLNLNPIHHSLNLGLTNENADMKMSSLLLQWDENNSKFISRYVGSNHSESTEDFFWNSLIKFREKIYRFSAERPNLGKCLVGFDKELRPDASNLAEVLQNTQNDNHDVYEEFNKYVSEVIPSVKWISSSKFESQDGIGNWNEVRVWSVDKKTRRTDLAFPLSASGTGIGQVLAILYVAIASEEPRTIIIDEPNSFLHPGAAKKLIQILNKFPQHQYFISTHSPEILSAAKPSTITRLKYVDGETVAESINPEQTKDLRETLDEIGVRFSDVFFSENIVWVEGETEEKAFPMILETADQLLDVAILPLVHTDDLKQRKSKGQKHAKLVFEIYERLSGANALTPPFVAVILDKESSSQEELNKLSETFGEKLKFIPRMMYENYLLDADAITNVLNDEIIEDENKVNAQQVAQWLTEKREARFLAKNQVGEKVLEVNDWLENVHAANLLEELFSELSGKTVEYRKTTHSVRLTQWLLESNPEQLAELKDFLLKILSE